MSDIQLLFKGPMVRAVLREANPKTQTRRIITNTDWYGCLTGDCPHATQADCDATILAKSPYGVPGSTVWVRETWRAPSIFDALPPRDIHPDTPIHYEADGVAAAGFGKTRVSIHMPRWFSRIDLEVTAVRVQRLQDISEEDALAEGLYSWTSPAGKNHYGIEHADVFEDNPISAYKRLWESIHGVGSWDLNPYVWAISFKKVRP